MRILVIDDEQNLVQLIKQKLRQSYIVDAAYTGRAGSHLAQVCNYDLIILDLGLPDIHGSEVCRAIRDNRVQTPILVLTGEDTIKDKVSLLDLGADDYLTKPFSFSELIARIRALLRRATGSSKTNLIMAEDLLVDTVERTVSRQSMPIPLRRKEFDLLEYLVRNRGKVLKRGMILEHVWDDDSETYTNVVDVHIKYLRDKIDRPFEKKLIRTIHGIGYKID